MTRLPRFCRALAAGLAAAAATLSMTQAAYAAPPDPSAITGPFPLAISATTPVFPIPR